MGRDEEMDRFPQLASVLLHARYRIPSKIVSLSDLCSLSSVYFRRRESSGGDTRTFLTWKGCASLIYYTNECVITITITMPGFL